MLFSYVFNERCRKLPKGLKDWQAYLDLKKRIDDFSESCPLLEMMTNKAMKLRHWNRISETTGHPFDVESDSFCLRNIMEAPLLKHKDDIEVNIFFFAYRLLYFRLNVEKTPVASQGLLSPSGITHSVTP